MAHDAKAQKQQMMLTEDVRTLIPKMAVPTIVAQLITTIYNIVDAYFVSTLGTNATAAVGVNSSLERTITLIGSLIGAGACSYISRLLGAKRDKDADRVLSTSFFSGLALGVVFMIICRAIIGSLVYVLGADVNCAEYSIQYASYVLYAAPFMIGSFILNMCLRSEGSATFAMVGIGIGGVLNCFLDPVFIYGGEYGPGIFGIQGLGLGVAGASMATALSKFISFCILLFPYIRKKTNVAIALKKIKFVWDDIKNVLTIGSASFFRSAMSVVASVVINNVAVRISTSALAALSIANRIMEFPFAIILGFGMGYQPVVGFNWGAKQMNRVKESLTFACTVSVIGAVVMGVIIFLACPVIVPLFNKQADGDVLAIGMLCIRLQCVALIFHAWGSIINMFYAGIGKGKQALAMSTARQGYCLIPVALIAPFLWKATGIAATQAIADVLSMAVAVPLTFGAFKLIQKRTEEVEAEEKAANA
ncbi:MAG: MATE family efflux transporter [Oscillospiraceae bacterium]|nr:MATE family efflux transporter [Oscillospiraceae bacterium]